MDKVLLIVGEESNLVDLISLVSEGEFDFQTIVVDTNQAAREQIITLGHKLFGIFNLVETTDIVNNSVYQENIATRKASYVHLLDSESIDPDKYKDYFAASKYHFLVTKQKFHLELHDLIKKIEQRFDIESELDHPVSKDGKKLYKVNINRYLAEKRAQNDIYIKIGAGKYIKIFHAETEIDHSQIIEYKGKGEKYLYQAEQDFIKTVNKTMSNLVKMYKSNSNNKTEIISLQLATIKEVQNVVRNMGISDTVMETTDELVKSVEKMLKGGGNLGSLVKKLLSLKSTFFTRASICNYLLGAVAEKMGWESEQTLKKLIYASVFCDFSFEVHESKLAEILHMDDIDYRNLGKVQQLKIKTHPKLSAAILQKGNRLLTDEATLVLHHHEKPDGSGFPEGLNYKSLPVLSCAFILVYDFTTSLIKSTNDPKNLKPLQVLESLGDDYSKANFNKPYWSLKEILEK